MREDSLSGYPSKRYYGGCEYIDIFEETARKYAKKLFGAEYANVQPHSGSSANMAVYRALLNHGDKVMGSAMGAVSTAIVFLGEFVWDWE